MSEPPKRNDSLRPPGTVVGRYVIVDVLGRGGMGHVYLAYDAQLNRRIAIKVLRRTFPRKDLEAGFRLRLLREAQAMAKLSHPNVVTIYDVGTFEDGVFLAMEYVEGSTLRGWLDKQRTWREIVRVLQAAGEGLAAAHAAGLVHRDFKPDNILIGKDGRVRVTDFGIVRAADTHDGSPDARHAVETPGSAEPPGESASDEANEPTREEGRRPSSEQETVPGSFDGPYEPPDPGVDPLAMGLISTPLTEAGSVIGTVGFAAPEQLWGEPVGPRSDQFSFCATLYLALYGQRAFPAAGAAAYRTAVDLGPREPPRTDVPEWLRRIVFRGLARRPEDRFSSMAELIHALAQDPAARRRKWYAAAGTVLLATAAVLGYRQVARQNDLPCQGVRAELAGAWDDAIREDVRTVFGRAGASDTFDRVVKVLDAYTGSWVAMRKDVCEATRVRRDQPEDVYRLRNDCLDRRRTELRAVAAMLRQADAAVVSRAIDAAYGLSSVGWCADVKALRASVGLPEDPRKRAEVLEVRDQMATAASLRLGGRVSEALDVAEHAVAKARATGSVGTEAEALLLLGQVHDAMSDYPAAEPVLAEATWTAQRAAADVVAAQSAALVSFVLGTKLQRLAEARVWLGMAKASLERAGGNEELETDIASREAALLMAAEWRPDLALPVQERVVRHYRQLLGPHLKTARALLNLAVNDSYLGRRDEVEEAAQGSLSMFESLYGPDHPWTAQALYMVGHERVVRGELPQGRATLERALAIFERTGGDYWVVTTLQALSLAAWLDGDTEQALALGRRALGLLENVGTALFLVPTVNVTVADALLTAGKVDEALRLCDRAIAVQESASQIAPEKVYGWDALRCRAEALVALGRPREAIEPLRRSITLPHRIYPGDLARTRFALARVLVATGTDVPEARAMAEEARDDLARLPFARMKMQAAAVDAWLARP